MISFHFLLILSNGKFVFVSLDLKQKKLIDFLRLLHKTMSNDLSFAKKLEMEKML